MEPVSRRADPFLFPMTISMIMRANADTCRRVSGADGFLQGLGPILFLEVGLFSFDPCTWLGYSFCLTHSFLIRIPTSMTSVIVCAEPLVMMVI